VLSNVYTKLGTFHYSKNNAIMLLIPTCPSYGVTFISDDSRLIQVGYRYDYLNETTAIIAHELGHLARGCGDRGYGQDIYIGEIQNEDIDQNLGATFSSSGPYDLMSTGFGSFSPYTLYGLRPFHTKDILKNSNVFLDGHQIINETELNNKTNVRLKAIRSTLSETDLSTGVKQVITIPINGIDTQGDLSDEVFGDLINDQKFIIELRDGKGFDDIAPMYYEEGSCKGILISHVIGNQMIDIECAEALPIDSRNPLVAWQYFPSDYPDSYKEKANGIWYFGKKINDWMDDVAPNYEYSMLGGKSTCWTAENAEKNQSLPSDFFNNKAGRNMFTPVTRPSTRTWKDNETNVGIYIDNVESGFLGDYADLRIYRNYHSTPLTVGNAKELIEGEKGLQIKGDGYIGENFYVDNGLVLYIGDDSPSAKTTLVPNTDMHVRNMGLLQIMDNASLRLESSILNMESGSQFVPYNGRIELDNSELNFNIGSEIYDYRLDNYEITSIGLSSFHNTDFQMIGPSLLVLNENSKFTILSGSNVTLSSQSVLTLRSGSHLNIEEGSAVYLSAGTRLVIEGNAEITGNLVIGDGAIIEIRDNAKLLVNNSNINIHPATTVTLGISSVLEVGANSSLNLDGGLPLMLGDDASIIIKDKGSLITTNLGTENVTFRNSGEMWYAIMCEVGSKIEFYGTEIIGAKIGIWGTPEFCRIENSSFLDCENGISLVNCPDYVITNNRMTGKGLNSYGYAKGSGITLTNCSLPISGNTIQNYADGIKLVSSSIILAENRLINNYNSGLLITGNGSKPVLVNSLSKDLIPRLNNEIYGNNINYPIYNGAQIYMRYSAGAYMTGGYNNIYSGQTGVVPSVPCIRGIWITTPVPVISKVIISAERNYWGYGSIDEINQPDFFYFRNSTFDTGYSIDFDPYALVPYTEDGTASTDLSTNEPRSTEATMLLNAMKLEDTGSSKASIKLYENIIKKYPNTPEYYVAESRLPGLYIEEELPLETILSSFDEAIENETALGKKFFKGLRVSTHIKAKNYDTAIMYAEEMKNEAETEEEAMLSEIDIAVANLMKEAEGSGKSGSSTESLEKLLNMLNGNDNKDGNPSDLAEASIPTQHELFQNYPNPFNPVTQIKFALAKTSDVRLSVYNISGQKIVELANGTINAGYHTVDFDGSRFNSGVYYYMLEVDGRNITKKMVLTK